MTVSEHLDRRLRALSDPTRRDIVARTLHREYAVTELAAAYPMTFASVQRHVSVLEEAELVVKRAVHRHRYVRARPEALDDVQGALVALRDEWRDRVERMHDVLAEDDAAVRQPAAGPGVAGRPTHGTDEDDGQPDGAGRQAGWPGEGDGGRA